MNIPAGNETLTVAETPRALNERQELFAMYYCGEAKGNATQAAKMAGYSPDTAYSIGSRLLKHVEVRAYIDDFLRGVSMTQGEVMWNLSQMGKDPNILPLARGKALETMARIYGMIIERNKVEQSNDITVRVVREHAIKATVQRTDLLEDGVSREP